MTKNILTQKELKRILDYNETTGEFIKLFTSGSTIKGDVAGTLQKNGYIQIEINNKGYKAHRLAWLYVTGFFPREQIDHINHVRNDNRFLNLRECSNMENAKNNSMPKSNTSGFVGVNFSKSVGKWHARICFDGKRINLGYFALKDEAILARKEANVKYDYHENHGMVEIR